MTQFRKKMDACFGAVKPQLDEIRKKALAESAFRYYRGTCDRFANDILSLYSSRNGVTSWICGDLHFENFGSYKGENRLVYFDLNDFDESILAWPELEVARLLTSIAVGVNSKKIPAARVTESLKVILDAYVTTLGNGKALMMEAEVASGEFKEYFDKISTADRSKFIDSRTSRDKDGKLRLKTDGERYIKIDKGCRQAIYEGLTPLLNKARFRSMEFKDVAIRIAGTGSLGLERYCVLCYNKKKDKYYLIDVKEAKASCYSGLVKVPQPSFGSEAKRIRNVGAMLQFNAPAYETTISIGKKSYLVRELQPTEDKMDMADFKNDIEGLTGVGCGMATLMAYAHIRSSGHLGSSTADELMAFAKKKDWQKTILQLTGELARRNEAAYRAFKAGKK